MRGSKKHALVWVGAALLLLFLAFLLKNRFSGNTQDIALSTEITASVDEVRLRFSDTCFLQLKKNTDGQWQGFSGESQFEADAALVNDFLSVFNAWEIFFIPTDSQASAWNREMADKGGKLLLKSGRRKLLQASFLVQENGLVLKKRAHPCYSVVMAYRGMDWLHFFNPDKEQWHNRLLLNLDYMALASVCVDYKDAPQDSYCLQKNGEHYLLQDREQSDTVSVAVAQAYLSAFGRVYFDFREPKARTGRLLYTLEILTQSGARSGFKVFEKRVEGRTDIFKAVVAVEQKTDTVEMPYVVLDKLVKTAGWFHSR